MHYFTAILLLGLCACSQASDVSDVQAPVTHLEAQGNLESKHALGCITLTEAKNQYTPADLFPAIAACVKENKLAQAADLYILARSYGGFDTMRVTDRTAHQAVSVLQMQAFSGFPEDTGKKMHEAIKAQFGNAAEHSRICATLRQLGAPDYPPTYMLQHGMEAFRSGDGRSKALAEDFNAENAWNEVLTSIGKCSD
ncbi:hypothetical protein CO611_01265 [Lysobacteraceae bacterium NML03-0222]|nr:hypothetical protein CO611_01265 [Xanthomonadaceae bacterium NML03-0222]